jgi:hypothetical protein
VQQLDTLCVACVTVCLQLSRPKEHQDLHRLVRMGMWTKLRPGVREFLRQAAEHFELWIYTAGSKPYADVSWVGGAELSLLCGDCWSMVGCPAADTCTF